MKWCSCLFLILTLASGCKKFIDAAITPKDSPTNVDAYEPILYNDIVTVKSTPGLGVAGADDYSPGLTVLQSGQYLMGIYSWNADQYQGGSTDLSWESPYNAIYQCNTVLYGLELGPHSDSVDRIKYRQLHASALFQRAFHFLNLQETYGQPFRPATAAIDAGIPLRLDASASSHTERASVKDVFTQIISDLQAAAPGLPPDLQVNMPNHPCRAAAYILLARAALIEQSYTRAEHFSDTALGSYNTLMMYDTVRGVAAHPFYAVGNPEVLYQCSAITYPLLQAATTTVDKGLYGLYAADDLRRSLFFQSVTNAEGMSFRGTYAPGRLIFSGISVAEAYLIRAECRARRSDTVGAIADLNLLLSHRWRRGSYIPYNLSNVSDILQLVLRERRKEMPFRDLRWSDIRRLAQDARTAVACQRVLGGSNYLLPPNDLRYAWQIPLEEIARSHIPQNP